MSDDLFHAGRGFPFDHISPSFVNKFLRCPLAALYYKEGRPMVWDPRYAEVGKYTHSILEREYRPDVRAYIPEGGMDDMMRKRHDAAMLGYRRLIKAEPRFRPKAGIHHPEVRIRSEISGVPLVGIIDLLTTQGTQVYIDDWKTGTPRAEDDRQMLIYTMMVSETLGIPPRSIVSTLDYLRAKTLGGVQKRVPYTGTKAIRQDITASVIEPIADLDFHPRRGAHCERCEYRHACEAWGGG